MQKIATCLWFDGNAEEAVNFYVSVFANSRIVSVLRAPPGGPMPADSAILVTFELEGQTFLALNGGPQFKFSEAISLSVSCATQAEVDALWEKLTAGGQPSDCSWLKDKYGLSWQICPKVLIDLLMDPDRGKAGRVMNAMMTMSKIDIAKLQQAAAGA